ncbi:hypothetical protein SKAU_G00332340 [Synaphobranchus kaupii]|uniref:Uncharacterized protein n=1 Tax=Synaphobranchus kaupii TaxID=118154 RepID=A0A9Q1ELF0_SYNKA|nr:hypothetical protein SKAU_G00332340 [Synaphobranchus kaupii]
MVGGAPWDGQRTNEQGTNLLPWMELRARARCVAVTTRAPAKKGAHTSRLLLRGGKVSRTSGILFNHTRLLLDQELEQRSECLRALMPGPDPGWSS